MVLIYADLHIHSRFSRATSKYINLDTLEETARQKGLHVIGTGDLTHPSWLSELKNNLNDREGSGLYVYKSNDIKFILTTEISLIYSQNGKTRKIHNIIIAPNFDIVEQITDWLKTKGRTDYDGRPIFGFDCPTLVDNMMSISKDIMVIPAHIFTPWFSLFGSMSGFDSVEDCFKDQTKHIHALETGLSADPLMIWRISDLDKYTLVSNSDAHSANLTRLGREFNAMELKKLTYNEIVDVIKSGNPNQFKFTCEVNPSLGKYHFDGHRNCGVSLHPSESKKYKNICPKCGHPLTIGVLHRVEELADRKEGFIPEGKPSFKSLLPLVEIVSTVRGSQTFTKKTMNEVFSLIKEFGSEIDVLLEASPEKLRKVTNQKLTNIILLNREGKIKVQPGSDGVYGRIISDKEEKINSQTLLGQF